MPQEEPEGKFYRRGRDAGDPPAIHHRLRERDRFWGDPREFTRGGAEGGSAPACR